MNNQNNIQNQPVGGTSKYRRWVLAVVLGLVLAFAGYYFFGHKQAYIDKLAAKSTSQPYKHTYSKLSHYNLAGPQAGDGAAFDMPAEFGDSSSSADGVDEAQFSEGPSVNNRPATISKIAVAVVKSNVAPTPDFMQTYNKALLDPKDPNHTTFTQPIEGYASQRIGQAGYNFTFSTPKAFTTANIKSNAWVMDFKATAKPGNSNLIYPLMQGQTGLIVGQKAYYYFVAAAVDYNWQAQPGFWQSVVNSLQIDR